MLCILICCYVARSIFSSYLYYLFVASYLRMNLHSAIVLWQATQMLLTVFFDRFYFLMLALQERIISVHISHIYFSQWTCTTYHLLQLICASNPMSIRRKNITSMLSFHHQFSFSLYMSFEIQFLVFSLLVLVFFHFSLSFDVIIISF